MGGKMVRYQLIAFVLVTVLGISYAMTQYFGLERILGFGQYRVSVQLPDTGGLYQGADVTEEGVTVGRVQSVDVHGHGILASISLNNGTQIPSRNLKAAVMNTSAVGEQYLELTPGSKSGPDLAAGDVVPRSEVSLPPNPTQLLGNLNALLKSVPQKQLGTTINELYTAFNGSGPQLRQLLTSAGNLLATAQQNATPTKNLINQLQPVLGTQQANSGNIKQFSRDLQSVSAQLKASNPDLSGTLAEAPSAIGQLNALIGQIQPTVPLLLANLTSVGQVLHVYIPGIRQSLVILPAVINNIDAATMDSGVPGSANAVFASQVNSPAACTKGYNNTPRDPYDTRTIPPPKQEPHCTEPQNSPIDVRGERNSPCPNNPSVRSATAAGCGLYFGDTAASESSDSGKGASSGSSSGSGSGSGGNGAGTYDPSSGLLVGPSGMIYSAGQGTLRGTGPTTLQGLLQQSLGG
ncbi:MAG: MCE family protein [Streptosporangiales bacterium]|nr:MCE family protein [Streptosporangiales bacterium]